eukprot:12421496-Karenia_brevis.AAC.1
MLDLCQPLMRVLKAVGSELRACWSFVCTGVGFPAHTRGLLVNRMHRRGVWGTPTGRHPWGGR